MDGNLDSNEHIQYSTSNILDTDRNSRLTPAGQRSPQNPQAVSSIPPTPSRGFCQNWFTFLYHYTQNTISRNLRLILYSPSPRQQVSICAYIGGPRLQWLYVNKRAFTSLFPLKPLFQWFVDLSRWFYALQLCVAIIVSQ